MRILCRSFVVRILARILVALVVYASVGRADVPEKMTPLLLDMQDAPVPFMGSDGRVHLVYELWVTNFSRGDIVVEKVEVLGDGDVLQSLDAAAIAGRLQAAGQRESAGTLARSVQALLFVHVTLEPGAEIPRLLSHRVTMHVNAAPPGQQEITESGGEVAVDRKPVVSIGPPLRGAGYISADSAVGQWARMACPTLCSRLGAAGCAGPRLRRRSRKARELHDLWQACDRGCRCGRRVGDRWSAGADTG